MKAKKTTLNDLIGKPIQRDEAYQMRLFAKALSEEVKKDVIIEFGNRSELLHRLNWPANFPKTQNTNKVKAYCRVVNSFIQFPSKLRNPGQRCICDIVSTEGDKVNGFWRYIKGTVRQEGSDKVIA